MDGETNLKSQTRGLADCRGDDWFLEGRSSLNNIKERKTEREDKSLAQKTERKQQNNNVAYKHEEVSKGSIALANF